MPLPKQPINFLSTPIAADTSWKILEKYTVYPERYVYDSKDRFFGFTECDVQARDSRIDFGSQIALRQATEKASCEVN